MAFTFDTIVPGEVDALVPKVTEALKAEGFGVLTEINVKETLKKKLNVDFRPYRILGACNPPFALQALTAEPLIGAMLPCNVVLQEDGPNRVKVSAVDPVASMAGVDNAALRPIAAEIQAKLKRVIASL
jgi:uncharacterized protein (DUF302 family)